MTTDEFVILDGKKISVKTIQCVLDHAVDDWIKRHTIKRKGK